MSIPMSVQLGLSHESEIDVIDKELGRVFLDQENAGRGN